MVVVYWILVDSVFFLIASRSRKADLRSFVSGMVKRHVLALCFLLKMIRNGVLHTAHPEVVLVSVSEIRLFSGVFIVLKIAGGQKFTRKISLPRARDAEIKSFENGSHPSM
ncbi:hypothetical protein V144x_30420 [Gimesia aquarii]|uniref:Uncharacterized protein n=1 Tax=Gimesia aquarii TaxID=2527964 RepID=A0A517VX27_9PLAN|nr:hypothetical protein V144x_30420 [Gimesia aquarii]